MYVLQLNPMTSNAEHVVPVCRAETEQELLDFLERERVKPYRDGQWGRSFREGPLHWFNPPDSAGAPWIGVPAIVYVGTEDEWAQRAREDYNDMLSQIPYA